MGGTTITTPTVQWGAKPSTSRLYLLLGRDLMPCCVCQCWLHAAFVCLHAAVIHSESTQRFPSPQPPRAAVAARSGRAPPPSPAQATSLTSGCAALCAARLPDSQHRRPMAQNGFCGGGEEGHACEADEGLAGVDRHGAALLGACRSYNVLSIDATWSVVDKG